MKPDLHRRATEVLERALKLGPQARSAFIAQACGDDAELRGEVESLRAHLGEDTIVGDRKHPGPESKASMSAAAGVARRMFQTRRFWGAVAASLLLAVGFWVHERVEATVLEVRARELEAVLDADITALELWVEEQKVHLKVASATPRLVALAQELITLGEAGDAAIPRLQQTPAGDELRTLLRPFDEATGNAGSAVLDPSGFAPYITNPRDIGLRLRKPLMQPYVERAMAGELVFVRPYRAADSHEGVEAGTMYTQFLGPLADDDGAVFGMFGFAHQAYDQFSRIFEVARMGETGETYAFDDAGLMLSESRFTEELRTLGLAPVSSDEDRAWDAGAQLNVSVRVPGVADGDAAARPLTALASAAINAGRDPASASRGLVMDPYSNYRGAEVLGAWRWLPAFGFAVATEIEVDEALAPLWYLDLLFGALFMLLSASVVVNLFSVFATVGLRREVRELGQYRLAEPVGRGGMGTVYLAQHKLMKRPTAVKVLSDSLSEESIQRFEQEVRLASELNHPNTIAIYDFGRTREGVFYYAMELVEGPTLAQLVADQGPLPPARVAHLLRQVCGSLGEAHRKGLVHRDIKPQNIMVCERGGELDVVKVLDFGLVESVDASSEGIATGARVGGTPTYLAPERLLEPSLVDPLADIYAVGAVAYFLLTGKQVFEPSGDLDLLYRIAQEPPTQLSTVAPSPIPRGLEALVSACLAKDPEDRPATATAIVERLETIPDLPPWTTEDARRWWARHPRNSAA